MPLFDGVGQDVKGSAALEFVVPSQAGLMPQTLRIDPTLAPPTAGAPRALLNLTGGYARGGAVFVQRGLALTEDGLGLVVSDSWQHTRAQNFLWRAYTAANVSVNVDGRSFTLRLNGQTLTVYVIDSAGQPVTLSGGPVKFAFPDTGVFEDLHGDSQINILSVSLPAFAGKLTVQIGGSAPLAGVEPLHRWSDRHLRSIELGR